MTVVSWPPELRALGIGFNIAGEGVLGPATLGGQHQVGSFDGGYWIAQLQDISAVGKAAMLAYRRLTGLLQGGANQVLVPLCDRANAPWPGTERSVTVPFIEGSDTATFSDGTEFSQNVITIEMTGAGAVRSTRLEVKYVNAGDVVGGERFSINGHAYEVVQVLADQVLTGGATAAWQIRPPLREAMPVGTQLDFDDPVCRMIPVSGDQLNMVTWRGRTGTVSPTFIESFDEFDT